MKNLIVAAATLVAVSLSYGAIAQEAPQTYTTSSTVVRAWKSAVIHPTTIKAKARKSTVVKGSNHVTISSSKGGRGAYGTLIARYASAYGVPVGLAHAVVRVESNYRANARGGAGEIGLMQIKPSTARMLGYHGKASGLFNPETNIKYGMKYLAMAHRLGGGSVCGTILKYNAGHGAKRMNPVSAAYCAKVKRHMGA